MAIDPRDPELGKRIEEEIARMGDPPSFEDWQRQQGGPEPRVVRPFDVEDRERQERLAETRRRRDLGREGREAERMGMGGEQPPVNPVPPQQNQQLTEYERRSLEFLESIDNKLSELGTLQ